MEKELVMIVMIGEIKGICAWVVCLSWISHGAFLTKECLENACYSVNAATSGSFPCAFKKCPGERGCKGLRSQILLEALASLASRGTDRKNQSGPRESPV
jgi:hypothetical protein